jgi:hypothetical protein
MSATNMSAVIPSSSLDRFLACMEYQSCARPNHELGS